MIRFNQLIRRVNVCGENGEFLSQITKTNRNS